jgi:hypothetical protein
MLLILLEWAYSGGAFTELISPVPWRFAKWRLYGSCVLAANCLEADVRCGTVDPRPRQTPSSSQ